MWDQAKRSTPPRRVPGRIWKGHPRCLPGRVRPGSRSCVKIGCKGVRTLNANGTWYPALPSVPKSSRSCGCRGHDIAARCLEGLVAHAAAEVPSRWSHGLLHYCFFLCHGPSPLCGTRQTPSSQLSHGLGMCFCTWRRSGSKTHGPSRPSWPCDGSASDRTRAPQDHPGNPLSPASLASRRSIATEFASSIAKSSATPVTFS